MPSRKLSWTKCLSTNSHRELIKREPVNSDPGTRQTQTGNRKWPGKWARVWGLRSFGSPVTEHMLKQSCSTKEGAKWENIEAMSAGNDRSLLLTRLKQRSNMIKSVSSGIRLFTFASWLFHLKKSRSFAWGLRFFTYIMRENLFYRVVVKNLWIMYKKYLGHCLASSFNLNTYTMCQKVF